MSSGLSTSDFFSGNYPNCLKRDNFFQKKSYWDGLIEGSDQQQWFTPFAVSADLDLTPPVVFHEGAQIFADKDVEFKIEINAESVRVWIRRKGNYFPDTNFPINQFSNSVAALLERGHTLKWFGSTNDLREPDPSAIMLLTGIAIRGLLFESLKDDIRFVAVTFLNRVKEIKYPSRKIDGFLIRSVAVWGAYFGMLYFGDQANHEFYSEDDYLDTEFNNGVNAPDMEIITDNGDDDFFAEKKLEKILRAFS